MADASYVGQRISFGGALCTVRYVGQVDGTTGSWLGVEWDDASRGKHDGAHHGVRYFTCLSASPTAASFVRPTRPRDASQSFLSALREKYLSETDGAPVAETQIRISGSKVAEEVGFDKIWKKLARLRDLSIVILDGMRIAVATADGDDAIAQTCPSIAQLDLSRSLFEHLGPVVEICAALSRLRKLSINGNRFRDVLDAASLEGIDEAFRGVVELSLDETLLSWQEICAVAIHCPSLATLNAGSNQLLSLPKIDYLGPTSTLTTANLEFNEFTSLSDLAGLTALPALRNLHLKGNNITAIGNNDITFPPSLQYLDISYNRISDWSFVDALPTHMPGLNALRLSHNPVYDRPSDESQKASSSEESHMFTIARLPGLKTLNFAAIRPADRTSAETFYLSRIAKQLAAVPESAEHTVLALHPRYKHLCDTYGEPDIVRRDDINPAFLEARLISVAFRHGHDVTTVRVPKAFDIYTICGIAGKLYGLSPLGVRLVWETGEWDPAGGYDDADADSDNGDEQRDCVRDEDDDAVTSGRWVKREVELTDGPKQLGYCVDGMQVSIRVEALHG